MFCCTIISETWWWSIGLHGCISSVKCVAVDSFLPLTCLWRVLKPVFSFKRLNFLGKISFLNKGLVRAGDI